MMHIETLPDELQNIRDDGRSNEEIIAGFKEKGIPVFDKEIFTGDNAPIPSEGTVYQFLAVRSVELPEAVRSSAEKIFFTVNQQSGDLSKPPLRAALLLQERMTQKRLYADTVVMNEPVPLRDGKSGLVVLSREHDEGTSWIGFVDQTFPGKHDVLLMFLSAPPA